MDKSKSESWLHEHFRKADGRPKVIFQSLADAEKRVAELGDGTLHAYRCSFCGGYHIGHMSERTRLIYSERENQELMEKLERMTCDLGNAEGEVSELRLKLSRAESSNRSLKMENVRIREDAYKDELVARYKESAQRYKGIADRRMNEISGLVCKINQLNRQIDELNSSLSYLEGECSMTE